MHKLLVFAAAGFCFLSVSGGNAAGPAPATPVTAEPAPADARVPSQIAATGTPIVLEIGKGTLVRLDRPAATVFIANPDIADVQVKSPSLIYINAKSAGETVLYAVDAGDQVLLNSPVRVEQDLTRLRQSFQSLMPGENIDVKSIDSSLVLSGVVSSAGRAEKARALTAAIAREAKDAKIINELSVATPNQVNLRVRIAEVDRTVMKALGINLSRPNGQITFSTFNPPVGILAAGGTINARFGPAALPINVTLDALAQEGLVRNLAEPNLTAVSGQTASFLAGGEIPYVTTQLAGNGNAFIQTTLFKPFGVQLQFTPTIIDANHVSLRVHPEVSAPVAGATSPPPLTVRRAETTVELGSGESFALAGLYQDNTQETISKFPWLADLPILGQLFRSQQFQRSETELVIIVTPYLVKPSATAALAPTDGFVAPHDAEQIINASTYRPTLPAAGKGPVTRDGQGLIGPVGFRID